MYAIQVICPWLGYTVDQIFQAKGGYFYLLDLGSVNNSAQNGETKVELYTSKYPLVLGCPSQHCVWTLHIHRAGLKYMKIIFRSSSHRFADMSSVLLLYLYYLKDSRGFASRESS